MWEFEELRFPNSPISKFSNYFFREAEKVPLIMSP
jgi:hypothetical protein